MHLNIPGLEPIFDAMLPGGLYAVQTSSPPARAAVAVHSLGAALEHGPATLITNASPQRLFEHARAIGVDDLRAMAQQRRLQIYRLKESSAKNIFRHGADRFTQELEHFDIASAGLVVFDGADDLFTLQDPFVAAEQVAAYRDWAQQHGRCGLMIFSQFSRASHFTHTYQALLDHLFGAVRIESGPHGLEWQVDFWNSPSGMVASRTLPGRIEPNGALHVTTDALPAGEAGGMSSPAADEEDVYSMDSSLVGLSKQAKGQWTFCDNLVGLMHAARNATAASVILIYAHDMELRSLAQAVHMLRVSLGKRIRIVVRELNASLRYQNELLLMKLGANLVLHRDMPPARLLLSIESLKGQVFSREINVDFEAALASVTPTEAAGYLAPQIFVNEVETIIARSKDLEVPFSLARFEVPADGDADGQVDRFKLTRAGDILTATPGYLYLFLSACPQASLLPTLRRIGGESVEDDYPQIEFAFHQADTENLLAQLERHIERADAPSLVANSGR